MTKTLKIGPLPKPSEFGHYWLGARPTGGAVIFKVSKYAPVRHQGNYFASRGNGGGVLFGQGGYILCFETPEDAYRALLAAGEEGGKKS
jgi:hypothetical protein